MGGRRASERTHCKEPLPEDRGAGRHRRLRTGVQEGIHCRRLTEKPLQEAPECTQESRVPTRTHPAPSQMLQRSERHSSSEICIAKSCATTKGTPTPTEHYSQFENPAVETSMPLALTHSLASHARTKRNDFPVSGLPPSSDVISDFGHGLFVLCDFQKRCITCCNYQSLDHADIMNKHLHNHIMINQNGTKDLLFCKI